MLYLNSNDYGFDSQALGFPSVMGCQAIVLLTSHGLYGLHDLKAGNSEAARLKIEFFSNWANNLYQQKGSGQKLKLYGVINNDQQYSNNTFGNNDWDQMLRHIAQELNFNGEICKYRVNQHIDKPRKGLLSGGSIYIRFDVAHTNNSCIISYKRWSKMHSNDSHDFVCPNDYSFLRATRGINQEGTDVITTGYTSQAPGILTNSVNRIGKQDEGYLHVVSAKKIITL